ncbi:Protein of unknown function [Geoalkalibacter ferrihydriticus]|uniref:DUF3015 domain-containing protein n=2 Tax=Geoalkalibacter ferrihydriticus TaxID=392333 RepID=A0A0C2DQ76_9BACT|nr:DUF3015 family protein [Geoalkalibacter ferrihydriticus]KIH75539.1 hypothetical protein GFER_16500 [Geoalkalibacter ferrihydriticus DSM 17813]SDM89701.1 Protein of unknown function [Geoalkalibacter ferrihydriticus]
MKKLIVSVCAAATMVAVSSFAFADPYGTAGCGLGSVLFKDQPGGVQIFAATTNGTFGNQTFGITTGTLNCGDPIWVTGSAEMKQFVAHNMDALAMDIAAGSGETLDAFAELMQVPADQRAEFAASLQQNFAQVFTSENVVMAEVIDNAALLTH